MALTHFDAVNIEHISHAQNAHADAIARLASATTTGIDNPITIEVINKPLPPIEIFEIHGEDWMKPILEFLTTSQIHETVKSTRSFLLKASCYTILDGKLYKCGYNIPLLHCVNPSTTSEMLEEFHQGTCSTYEGLCTLASRILRYGYYWSHLHQDAKDYMSNYDQCQKFANLET